jgi:hypothetical protein
MSDVRPNTLGVGATNQFPAYGVTRSEATALTRYWRSELEHRHGGRLLAFFSTVTTFGTPTDVTVSELAIESFFPADPETATLLRGTG